MIVTIHNPSAEVFRLMDDLMLLRRGEVVYMGVLAHAQRYFAERGCVCPATENPADFFVRALGGLFGTEAEEQLHGDRAAAASTTADSAAERRNSLTANAQGTKGLDWGGLFRGSSEANAAAGRAGRAARHEEQVVRHVHSEWQRFLRAC